MPLDYFIVRRIAHLAQTCDVLLQNENGPCPLIALFNVLSLRGNLALDPRPYDGDTVSLSRVKNAVGSYVLDRLTATSGDQVDHAVQEALSVLDTLHVGLDVNVRFRSPGDFEPTQQTGLLDAAGVRLVHGWVADPADPAAADIGALSYNAVTAMATGAGEGAAQRAAAWIAEHADQMTLTGMLQLHEALRDGELAILFRNNHFATLVKHNGYLYTLVTDEGLAAASACVWETLDSDSGEVAFVPSFSLPRPPPRPVQARPAPASIPAPAATPPATGRSVVRAAGFPERASAPQPRRQRPQREAESGGCVVC